MARRLADLVKNGSCDDITPFEKSMLEGRKLRISRGSIRAFDNWIGSLKYEDGVALLLWKPSTGKPMYWWYVLVVIRCQRGEFIVEVKEYRAG